MTDAILRLPIVAVGDPWHDAAYAVFDGDRLRHVEIERLTRVKYETLNPLVAGCLTERETFLEAGAFLFEEGRFIAPLVRGLRSGSVSDPHAAVRTMVSGQHGSFPAEMLDSMPQVIDDVAQIFSNIAKGRAAYEIMDHHFCHAANAFISSDLAEAVVFTLDGGGDHFLNGRQVEVHGAVYRFDRMAPLSRAPLELVTSWSPGWAWTRACNLLGYDSYDAGTLMAMSAFGQPDRSIAEIVRNDTFWAVNSSGLSPVRRTKLRLMLKALRHLVVAEAGKFALALELQAETERRIEAFMRPHLERSGPVDICLSGGTFLNCILAAKVRQWFANVGRIYVPPVPYDAGICLGLAQTHLFERGLGDRGSCAPDTIADFAGGPTYSLIDVYAACRSTGRADPQPMPPAQLRSGSTKVGS